MPTKPSRAKPKKTNQRGVDCLVRKQVALDIHVGGGIQDFDQKDSFALDNILNNTAGVREALYKSFGRGTAERRKIRNLVQVWKGWSDEKHYNKITKPLVLGREGEDDKDTGDEEEHTPDFVSSTPTDADSSTEKEPKARESK
mgnify:CR=1 FL=1